MQNMNIKSIPILLSIIVVLTITMNVQDGYASSSGSQINFSLVLSGHVLIGVGYTYKIDSDQGLQATFYLAPEKGLPFGLNAGYLHLFGQGNWRYKLSGEFTILASPPQSGKGRLFLPMINLVPGMQYSKYNGQLITPQIWISYLPTGNKKIFPTAIEVRYGKSISD